MATAFGISRFAIEYLPWDDAIIGGVTCRRTQTKKRLPMSVRLEAPTTYRSASSLFVEVEWSKAAKLRRIEDRQMELRDLERLAQHNPEARALCGPFDTFFGDITRTEEGTRRLPVVAACVAPREPPRSRKQTATLPYEFSSLGLSKRCLRESLIEIHLSAATPAKHQKQSNLR